MTKVCLQFKDAQAFQNFAAGLDDVNRIDKVLTYGRTGILCIGDDLDNVTPVPTSPVLAFANDVSALQQALDSPTLPADWTVKGMGAKFYLFSKSDDSPPSDEAQKVIDRMQNLTAGEEAAIRKFVTAMESKGYWADIEDIVCGAFTDEANKFTAWKGTFNPVSGGNVVTEKRGWMFSGESGSFIDLGYTLATDKVAVGGFKNSWSAIFNVKTSIQSGNSDIFGVDSSGVWTLREDNLAPTSFESQPMTATKYLNTNENDEGLQPLSLYTWKQNSVDNQLKMRRSNNLGLQFSHNANAGGTPNENADRSMVLGGKRLGNGNVTVTKGFTGSFFALGNSNIGDDAEEDINQLMVDLGVYDIATEASTVVGRMSSLSAGEQSAIEEAVTAMVNTGIWASIDEFFCHYLNATDALVGWKTKTGSLNGGASYVAKGGISFGGVDADFFETNYNPSVDAVNLTLNDTLLMAYVEANNAGPALQVIAGCAGGAGTDLFIANETTDTTYRMRVYDGFSTTVNKGGEPEYASIGRSGGTKFLKAGANETSQAVAVGTIATETIHGGRFNRASSKLPFNGQVGVLSIGALSGVDTKIYKAIIDTLVAQLKNL